MPNERAEEVIARKLVQHVLVGAKVDRYEDGSRDGMVDAKITYPDGTIAALEVVSDHDPNYLNLHARIRDGGSRIDAPTLRNTWILNLKDHPDVSDVRAIRKKIVALLETLGAASLPGKLKWPDSRRTTVPAIDDEFTRLGVQFANSMPSPEPRVYLLTPFLGGWSADPNQLVDWVEQFLAGTAFDVPAKLAASGHDERHAFIWTTETTDYAATSALEVDEPLPTVAPRLPGGITHLWICSDHARHRMLAWDQSSGWREAYRIPDDGVIPFA